MTNKEFFLKTIKKNNPDISTSLIETIFNIVNECDWAIFCSQMGDYDHPCERIFAREEKERKFDSLIGDKATEVINAISVVEKEIENSSFYHKHFHTMDEICTEHKCVNCSSFNEDYPPPKCLICKTGFYDDMNKQDFFEQYDDYVQGGKV